MITIHGAPSGEYDLSNITITDGVAQNITWKNKRVGETTTKSGTGVATSFTIPHDLGTKPSQFNVIPNNSAAANIAYITTDSTNLTINYTVAPANGTNNLAYTWWADK